MFNRIRHRAKFPFIFVKIALTIVFLCSFGTAQIPAPKTLSTQKSCREFTDVSLQGFRVGMYLDDVLRATGLRRANLVKVATETKTADGTVHSEYMGVEKLDYIDTRNRFPGIYMISFRFVEEVLSEILVGYDGSIRWDSIEEFAKTVGKQMNLPENEWKYGKLNADGYLNDVAAFPLCEGSLIVSIQHKSIVNPISGNAMKSMQVVNIVDNVMRHLLEEELLYRIKRKAEEDLRRNADKKKVFKP